MKPPLIYLAVGAMLCAGGLASGRLAVLVVCLYAALPCLVIAAAYLFKRPQWLMKRPDGSLAPASWLLFGAFHVANRSFLLLYRKLVGVPQWHEVVPGLYLGECLRRGDRPDWKPEPFHILDVTAELAEPRWARLGPRYLCLPLLDRTAPSAQQLEQGIAFIRDGLARGSVYVHCAYGHSRSALFVVAYLLAAGLSRKPEEAVSFVASKRPGAYLNHRQWACLRAALPLAFAKP